MTEVKHKGNAPANALSRRRFVQSAALATIAAPFVMRTARAASSVKMASILDLSGGLDVYGKPMQLVMELAVDEINASGGLNGEKLELVTYDTQSNMQLYAQYAQKAALQDRVVFVNGGITSSSREVMRPILKRYKTLYFYSTQYEGGVCDQNTFCTGITPAMQGKNAIGWGVKEWGKRIYSIGADYNSPRIIGDWTRKFAKELGAEQIANDFFPLDVTDFGALITKIQAAKPDFICSTLVGAAHLGFYRQWAAAGMVGKIPILSFTFGEGNEHTMIPASESEGIVAPYSYIEEIDTPINKAFLASYHKKFGDNAPYQNNVAIGAYEATWLWATAVRMAGTTDREKVIAALESGATWEGPGGTLKMDGATHHCARDIWLAKLKGGKWEVITEWKDQRPVETGGRCDLLKDPTQNVAFTPEE